MKSLASALLVALMVPYASAHEVSVNFDPTTVEDWSDTYGEREVSYLTDRVTRDISRALANSTLTIASIEVTILDAKPNRPTTQQASDRLGLDQFRSYSLGGMSLHAEAFNSEGVLVGDYAYRWFEKDIRLAAYSPTWGDASRASDRFARQFVRSLAED
jgi:hypothetical protein